ncbi:class F sortase [Streptomyces gobiensis]|uniref:class F sortase n=1 Tax=Streptomyces gobiensis TaxID=2875706 RepID=UPI001E2A2B24|nr:class F sortase [Streptomyces gobiensis]UGY90699.1 class F sortase [Streptomyces gobiensis]
MDRDHRRRETIAATVTAIGLCAGVWLIDHTPEGQAPPQPSPAEAAPSDLEEPTADPSISPLAPSHPLRVRIPAISVDAPVMELELEQDGSLQTPPEDNANLTGWYRHGTAPGAIGTAIVAGHVDHATGPSVFYNLGALRKGHTVQVDRQDGSTAVFTIHAIEVYSRKDFPNKRVYGRSDRAELRLITCGGGYSESDGYLGNVVVYAHLTKVTSTSRL